MSSTHIQDKCYLVDYFKVIILLSISSMRRHPFISGAMVRFYVHLNRGLCNQVYVPCVLSRSVASDSFAASWTVAHQAPLFMGSFRREFWSRLHFLLRGDLPDLGIEPVSSISCIAHVSLLLNHQRRLDVCICQNPTSRAGPFCFSWP